MFIICSNSQLKNFQYLIGQSNSLDAGLSFRAKFAEHIKLKPVMFNPTFLPTSIPPIQDLWATLLSCFLQQAIALCLLVTSSHHKDRDICCRSLPVCCGEALWLYQACSRMAFNRKEANRDLWESHHLFSVDWVVFLSSV